MPITPRYRDLVLLFPRFLRLQPFGWKGPQDILQSGLRLSALLLLRALVQETDPGEMLSRQEMESRVFNPYSTFNPIFDSLPSFATASPMVHLEAAIFALWMARDDAHIAAWRARGLSGPQLDLLSHLWVGEVQTLSELTSALQQTQHPEDIADTNLRSLV